MVNRLLLHAELVNITPNVYFQPPETISMKYPCIVYSKSDKFKQYASDKKYINMQEYSVMVIDRNPDSVIADSIESRFMYCEIAQYYVVDSLNHTTLKLYY